LISEFLLTEPHSIAGGEHPNVDNLSGPDKLLRISKEQPAGIEALCRHSTGKFPGHPGSRRGDAGAGFFCHLLQVSMSHLWRSSGPELAI
jgi:hypothetical protein